MTSRATTSVLNPAALSASTPALAAERGAASPARAGRKPSVRRNFLWVLIGNAAYAGSQWVMLMLLTKLGSPEMVGQFALGLAWTAPIILFANLQLRSIQATDAAEEFAFADYFTLRAVAVVVAVGLIAGLALFGGYHARLGQVILALGLARGVECFSEIYLGLFQRRERMDLMARSLLLKAILSLAAFATTIVLSRDLVLAVWSLFGAWLVVLVCFDARHGRRLLAGDGSSIRWFSRDRKWLRLAWVALPLGTAAMLKALENSLPRYFIELQLGERELGLFAAAAYLTVVGIQIITALGQAASPRLALFHAQGNRAGFVRLLLRLLVAGFAIGLAGLAAAALLGRELLRIFYTAEYAQYHHVFVWLMAAAVLNYTYVLLGTSLNALRVFRFRFPVHVLALALLTTGCLVLGRTHGLLGMAWAVGLSELFTAGAYGAVLIHRLRQPVGASLNQAEVAPC